MKKLTICIAAYNGDDYIDTCLNSLLHQDIPHELYDIVVVNDCSKDNTENIVKGYQEKYSNIKLVSNLQNSGLCTTRNVCLKEALKLDGEYVWFMDQDDTIDNDCLGPIIKRMDEDQLDILLFNFCEINENGGVIRRTKVFDNWGTEKGLDFINKYFRSSFVYYLLGLVWRMVVRKDLLRDNSISFPTTGGNFDDTTFVLKNIVYSRRVAATNDAYYNYRVFSKSMTHQKIRRGKAIYEFAFLVGQEVEDFACAMQERDAVLADALQLQAVKYYNNFLLDLIRTTRAEKHIFYWLVRKTKKTIISKREHLNFLSKLAVSPCGYWIVVCLNPIYSLKHIFCK